MKQLSPLGAGPLSTVVVFALLALTRLPAAESKAPIPRSVSFDAAWKFFKGDADQVEKAGYPDQDWRQLDLPHDWSIEGPFSPENKTGGAGGFLPAGIGWYRKTFSLPESYAKHRVFIDLDGVMANSDVWINGTFLGHRPYGYVSFRYELTPHLLFGEKENVVAVRVDNSAQPASRWYSGAGIYRHVRLVVTDPVHLEHWGTFVTTPEVSAKKARIVVQNMVVNQSTQTRKVALQVSVLDPKGEKVSSATSETKQIPAGKSAQFKSELSAAPPHLWNPDDPALYKVVSQVVEAGRTLDEDETEVGLREYHFDPDTGFWINGKNIKLKGVCLHHDAGGFGAAVPLSAWERRLTQLKEVGCNAIRTSHNPYAPEFLDLCDRMGFLVMDEILDCWKVGKNPYDYHLYFEEWAGRDTRDTVIRDRNHPSVIIYSAGNEIHDTRKPDAAKQILGSLIQVFHETDPTRPVTQALFRPNVTHDYENGLADMLDVVGQNYREKEILAAHETKLQRKIIGTENRHELAAWLPFRDSPAYAGQFLWTGFDYLGEARTWPAISRDTGLFDRTGSPHEIAYQRKSWWGAEPMVHLTRRTGADALTPTDPGYEPYQKRVQLLFGDWSPQNPDPHEETVEVYSNCESVELSLNGQSLEAKDRPADDSPRVWIVPYAPGTLKAVGSNGGKVVATDVLETSGTAARINLSCDRKTLTDDWDEVAYVRVTIQDENGVLVPTAENEVRFELSGPGVIAAVDSGDNESHESFQAHERKAFQGRCLAIVRATSPGTLKLTASSAGLSSSSVTIEASAPGRDRHP
ncbi:MAG: beta-galactosidase [Chthoniobacter sp.]|jgi:beta-galactosidase|nr:beta-galactosidase [Chthoniobacter sp.]